MFVILKEPVFLPSKPNFTLAILRYLRGSSVNDPDEQLFKFQNKAVLCVSTRKITISN